MVENMWTALLMSNSVPFSPNTEGNNLFWLKKAKIKPISGIIKHFWTVMNPSKWGILYLLNLFWVQVSKWHWRLLLECVSHIIQLEFLLLLTFWQIELQVLLGRVTPYDSMESQVGLRTIYYLKINVNTNS